jgi:GntR family transcriptional regulator
MIIQSILRADIAARLRTIDSVAGMAVLFLLLVAVVGGQTRYSPPAESMNNGMRPEILQPGTVAVPDEMRDLPQLAELIDRLEVAPVSNSSFPSFRRTKTKTDNTSALKDLPSNAECADTAITTIGSKKSSQSARLNRAFINYNGYSMNPKWNEDLPIYRQLRDRVVAMILEEVLVDGDALPSVRNVAAEYRLNPLTVLKGYQELVDEGLVEKKRGRGMFVMDGARLKLLKDERRRFLQNEWPVVAATIARLGLTAADLLDQMAEQDLSGKGAQDD